MNYNQTHCHKWALLLNQRKEKLTQLTNNIQNGQVTEAKRLLQEIVYGIPNGKHAEPGMVGSLLYHMAMVTKMEAETRVLLETLQIPALDVAAKLRQFYDYFAQDADKLTQTLQLGLNPSKIASTPNLTTDQKIALVTNLKNQTNQVTTQIANNDPKAETAVNALFKVWAAAVTEMRLRQEYQTIKGILTLFELSKTYGVKHLSSVMQSVQDKFGKETVNIALNVTLKVGMRREKLQSVMLSDHYINQTMRMDTLDGCMTFLNCPIHGGHQYIGEKLGIPDEVTSLFCTHFCFAHANAMLETVMPFTFGLTQPKRMAKDGKCEFYLKLGYSPNASNTERFVPLVVSYNVTRRCNLKCSHCYINATPDQQLPDELTTEESKRVIDQIAEVSRPLLILSGGEPLLRNDIYELVKYGAQKGLRMGLGSNGTLIDGAAAKKLSEAGIKTVSVSLDSHIAAQHDEFRGVPGAWDKAINAIKVLRENDVLVQVNTTLTQENYDQIDDIMTLAEQIGVENYHLFFLVPTGRGTKIEDISPQMYEDMIINTFAKTHRHKLNVRPSCAPQFMRIAADMGLDMRQWIRGCIAGQYYCRIYANGDVTPCPYLPIKLGNVRETPFKEIWANSPVFKAFREPSQLKGKCGECEYKVACGGCRARAYGLSSDFIDYCGDLHEPTKQNGDFLTEDPWCVYQPKRTKTGN
jgi:radical SAM protein with 4Fe4S-binding SPASM domain